ncbi:unnamed protein product [Heterotrigona itama]|uniref:Bromo domain-containing protein n=1 Tax=Heterotrigona itama TaxID=395501 RepID=A0A6V7GWK5_9HYME|nr:unnamed protein product [Heterotrigona itama]
MEKRDLQQFFAWPVADVIAPGYSQIISNPMDFSTIRQKIAKTYNHPDTIYYKAANNILPVGLNMVTTRKLRQLSPVLTYMQDMSKEVLGFELGTEYLHISDVPLTEQQFEQEREREQEEHGMTPEEIIKQVRGAAKAASGKLTLKSLNSKVDFLRQREDGTITLHNKVQGDGVIPGTNQRPVSLLHLIGKLNNGKGALAGFRKYRRNTSKPIKPLYYGAFDSWDEVLEPVMKYGYEIAVQYAESILDNVKYCDYTLIMFDDLLEILIGDHRKTKKFLEEKRRRKEGEE